MNKEVRIRLRGIATGYRSKTVTKVVSHAFDAELFQGELTCLLGANGAGKSTLLRTLAGFLPSLEGEIHIDGKPLSSYSDRQLARIVGVVLTERCSIRNMSVYELIAMGRSPYTGFWGSLSQEDRHIIDESIHQVGIVELKERMVHTLSDGERQKVMIAKALAQQTPVIFLDEPTAFLDFPSKVEIMQLLHRLAHEMKKTVFLSTHDLELALQMADKVWLLDREKGVQAGVPEDLALEGRLTGFFHREGIVFDQESGLFRIAPHYTASLHLEGEGTRYAMVRKALARNGIWADSSVPQSSPYIEVTASAFRLWKDGQYTDAHSIEMLLKLLKSAIPGGKPNSY